MAIVQTRRRFIRNIGLAGAAHLIRAPAVLAAEPKLEITKVRLASLPPGVCIAPQYAAEELLRAEGFTEIEYVPAVAGAQLLAAMTAKSIDFSMNYAGPNIIAVDAGHPVVNLAGVHVGCFELFGHDGINGVADLKGKSVGVQALGSSQHVYLATMLAHIGLDAKKDINWVTGAFPTPVTLFADGKVDAYLGFAPEPQALRARKIGHVIVNSTTDPPWSQYFCCMVTGNREFVRKYPVATKRVLRAILKGADLCSNEPARVARQIVDGGVTPRYDHALEALGQLPYDKWREYDPDDTLRFYTLRLHEAGMVRSSPQKIISEGTDWRFLNELKREMKV
jgi:NitT/TauT family transport system substrate-binding protein